MSGFTATDHDHMARALRLARRGMYTAHPNPRVGCVIVKNGTVIGEGWHRKTGDAHAEISALADAGEEASDSTVYLTLEPCSHHGRTPPCADALVAAGVTEVIAAMEDPNLKVAGSGGAALQAAGIRLRTGLMQPEAEALNRGFISRVSEGRPLVRLKIAASLDGRTAMKSGESQWITGEDARRDVQHLRAISGAIMTGIGTALADDPSLTVRQEDVDNNGMQPLRVVLDSNLKLPPTARMLGQSGDTAVFCVDDTRRKPLEDAGARVVVVPGPDGRPDPGAVLGKLAELEINDVLVEAGPGLAGALLAAGFVDELVIYQAPHIMGSETRGMFDTPEWLHLGQRLSLEITDVRKVGSDTRITARQAD